MLRSALAAVTFPLDAFLNDFPHVCCGFAALGARTVSWRAAVGGAGGARSCHEVAAVKEPPSVLPPPEGCRRVSECAAHFRKTHSDTVARPRVLLNPTPADLSSPSPDGRSQAREGADGV